MEVLESDREIIRRIFYSCSTQYKGRNPRLYNMGFTGIKKYLEKHRTGYIYMDDFRELMRDMNIEKFKNNNAYHLRVKPEFFDINIANIHTNA